MFDSNLESRYNKKDYSFITRVSIIGPQQLFPLCGRHASTYHITLLTIAGTISPTVKGSSRPGDIYIYIYIGLDIDSNICA